MRIERFEDVKAWQEGRELTRMVYDVTKKLINGFIGYLQRSNA